MTNLSMHREKIRPDYFARTRCRVNRKKASP